MRILAKNGWMPYSKYQWSYNFLHSPIDIIHVLLLFCARLQCLHCWGNEYYLHARRHWLNLRKFVQFFVSHIFMICSSFCPGTKSHSHQFGNFLWIRLIDGLVQDCNNSIANALELLQSCTNPSIWSCDPFRLQWKLLSWWCEISNIAEENLLWQRNNRMTIFLPQWPLLQLETFTVKETADSSSSGHQRTTEIYISHTFTFYSHP